MNKTSTKTPIWWVFLDDVNKLQDFINQSPRKKKSRICGASNSLLERKNLGDARKTKRRLTLHRKTARPTGHVVVKRIQTKVTLSSVKRDRKSSFERVKCRTHGVSAWPCCQPTGHLSTWCGQWRLAGWFRRVSLYLLKRGLRSESQRRWPSFRRRTLETRIEKLGMMDGGWRSMLNLPA